MTGWLQILIALNDFFSWSFMQQKSVQIKALTLTVFASEKEAEQTAATSQHVKMVGYGFTYR